MLLLQGSGAVSAVSTPQQSGCIYNLGLRTQKSHLTVVSQPGASSLQNHELDPEQPITNGLVFRFGQLQTESGS